MSDIEPAASPASRPAPSRDEVREMAAGTVAAIIGVAAWAGLVLPNSAQPIVSAPELVAGQWGHILTLGIVMAGGLLLGGFAWAIAVERRLPWPFGAARPGRIPLVEHVVSLGAMVAVTFIAVQAWPTRGPIETLTSGGFLSVDLPANLGRAAVAGLLAWWVAPAVLRLARAIVGQAFEPAELPATQPSRT